MEDKYRVNGGQMPGSAVHSWMEDIVLPSLLTTIVSIIIPTGTSQWKHRDQETNVFYDGSVLFKIIFLVWISVKEKVLQNGISDVDKNCFPVISYELFGAYAHNIIR